MSGFEVIHRVGETLRDVLNAAFADDLQAKNLLRSDANGPEPITLGMPVTRNDTPTHALSLWLYMVREQEHAKNKPPRMGRDGTLRSASLTMSLYYLVTPGSLDGASNEDSQITGQKILGKVLQTFHSHPVVALIDPARQVAEELHLTLSQLTLEELTRVWDALQAPYRLSVCYRVNIARIDSMRVSSDALIVERDLGYGVLADRVA